MDLVATLRNIRGLRPVSGDAQTLLVKRTPRLPKSQMDAEMLAIDPLQAALSAYGDRADEALARAKLFQESEPLQFLDEGRWYGNRAAGVSGQDMPMFAYPGSVIPGTRGGIEGLFRAEPQGPRASIQVAMGSPNPEAVLLEEARHAIDRQLIPGEKQTAALAAPKAFSALMGSEPYDRAQALMKYYALPAEMRATLSGLLANSPDFISTRNAAEGLLEQASEAGSLRERATAEAIMGSKSLRNQYIPYLLKALSVGAMVPAEAEQ